MVHQQSWPCSVKLTYGQKTVNSLEPMCGQRCQGKKTWRSTKDDATFHKTLAWWVWGLPWYLSMDGSSELFLPICETDINCRLSFLCLTIITSLCFDKQLFKQRLTIHYCEPNFPKQRRNQCIIWEQISLRIKKTSYMHCNHEKVSSNRAKIFGNERQE